MAYFPLFINLKNKEVLVVGGGDVSFQEISMFLAFEAKIVLIADPVSPNLEVLVNAYSSQIRFVHAVPSLETIQASGCRPTLVIAATQDVKLNAQIYTYYQDQNVLVEDISNRGRCDFIFPAIIKRGDVVCGISSSGKSPHVSQFVKGLVESSIPESIGDINDHMDEIRSAVKQSISDPAKRKRTLQAIFTRLIEDDNQTPDYEIDGIIGEAELY